MSFVEYKFWHEAGLVNTQSNARDAKQYDLRMSWDVKDFPNLP